MITKAMPDVHALKIALQVLRAIADGRETGRGGRTEIVGRDAAAAIASSALHDIAKLEAREDVVHADRTMLQEIADGAYGHNPAVRGAGRDRLKQFC